MCRGRAAASKHAKERERSGSTFANRKRWIAALVLGALVLCALSPLLVSSSTSAKRSCDVRVRRAQHRVAELIQAKGRNVDGAFGVSQQSLSPHLRSVAHVQTAAALAAGEHERKTLEHQLRQMEATVHHQQQRWLQQHLEHAKMSAKEQAELVAHEEHLTKTIDALSQRLQESRQARGETSRQVELHERQFDEQEKRLFTTIDSLEARLNAQSSSAADALSNVQRQLAASRRERERLSQQLELASGNLGAASEATSRMQVQHKAHAQQLVLRLQTLQSRARHKSGKLAAKLRVAVLENERLRATLLRHGIKVAELTESASVAHREAVLREKALDAVRNDASTLLRSQSSEFEAHQLRMEEELARKDEVNEELRGEFIFHAIL